MISNTLTYPIAYIFSSSTLPAFLPLAGVEALCNIPYRLIAPNYLPPLHQTALFYTLCCGVMLEDRFGAKGKQNP